MTSTPEQSCDLGTDLSSVAGQQTPKTLGGGSLKILALDLGTYMGWAHVCGVSGTWNLSVQKDESSGMRLLRLRGKLNAVKESEGIDLICFEAFRYTSQQSAAVVLGEIQATVKLWCHDNGAEYKGYSPTEIKKHATGRGNAGKSDMRESAIAKWGEARIGPMDDNEVDALWLLDMGLQSFGSL
jgi:Holliday junction resolvasome RuvABC endonuclease subunit